MANSISTTSNNPENIKAHQAHYGLSDDGLCIINLKQQHIPQLPLSVRGNR